LSRCLRNVGDDRCSAAPEPGPDAVGRSVARSTEGSDAGTCAAEATGDVPHRRSVASVHAVSAGPLNANTA
jgi:hypothetical protein